MEDVRSSHSVDLIFYQKMNVKKSPSSNFSHKVIIDLKATTTRHDLTNHQIATSARKSIF